MPRYYLNVRRDRVLIEDPDGDEAADLPAIRRVAEETIEDILRRPETYGEHQRWDRCTFEITDESGATVLKVPFSEFAHPERHLYAIVQKCTIMIYTVPLILGQTFLY